MQGYNFTNGTKCEEPKVARPEEEASERVEKERELEKEKQVEEEEVKIEELAPKIQYFQRFRKANLHKQFSKFL